MTEHTTVLGLALMGSALARTLLRDDIPTTVWNRTPRTIDGATQARSAVEAMTAGELVLACVSTYDVLETILDGGALEGRTLVNLTSGTPRQARELGEWAVAQGIDYLDGAIMAVPPMIGLATTRIFYSGTRSGFERHRRTLEVLGGRPEYLGEDAGLAALYDASLLSAMYGTYAGALHAFALAGNGGVAAKDLAPYLTDWLGNVVGWLPRTAEAVDERNFATEVSNLDVNKAGVEHIVEASRDSGVAPGLLLPLLVMLDRRVGNGHGAEGLAGLIEELR